MTSESKDVQAIANMYTREVWFTYKSNDVKQYQICTDTS